MPPPGRPPRRPGATRRRKKEPRRQNKSWQRRSLTIAAWTLGPFALLAIIIFGTLYFRLSQGPISLKPLIPSIERNLSADLGGITAKVDDAFMMLGDDGFEFRLTKLELTESDGDLVASAPLASAAISTTDLFKLQISPKRVYLIEPQVYLFYSDDGGLALSFSGTSAEDGSAAPIVAPAPVPAQRPQSSVIAKTAGGKTSERISLAKTLIDLNERAQRGLTSSARLRQIGVKDANVVLVFAGQTSNWRVPNFVIGLDNTSTGTSITGSGFVNSGYGEWRLGIRTEETRSNNAVKLRVQVDDFLPSSLAAAVPRLSLFKTLDMRVQGEGSVDLTAKGDVASANLEMNFGRGNIYLPNVAQPLAIESGSIGMTYNGQSNELVVLPSTVKWGHSFVTLTGAAKQSGNEETGDTVWNYHLASQDGSLGADDLGIQPEKIDALLLEGQLVPKSGLIKISKALLRAGGGEMSAKGEIASGAAGSSTLLEGGLANLDMNTVKALWPTAFAKGARRWVGERLFADVRSGTMRLASGDYLAQGETAEPGTSQRMTYALEAANLRAQLVDDAEPMTAERALIRGENQALELSIPEAGLPAAGKRVEVQNVRFLATDLGTIMPMGDLSFRLNAPIQSAVELARKIPDGPLAGVELPPSADGEVTGDVTVRLPLIETLQHQDVKVSGKVRVAKLKSKIENSKVELQGGTVDVDMTEEAIEANGDLILNGVVAKLAWKHVLNVPEAMQEPLTIKAKLDSADRTQLGMDVNHMVQGEVPVEVTVHRLMEEEPAVHLEADLTAAQLYFEDVAWRKPAGRKCKMELNVGKTRPDGRVELDDIKVVGDDIAIEGTAVADPDNEIREFEFPRFSLGLVSRLRIAGRMDKNRVWKIKAKGSTYDGRSYFDSLFDLNAGPQIKALRPAKGVEVEAEISTVLGYQESALKDLKIKMTSRDQKVVALDARASLPGGKTFKAVIPRVADDRRLYAESDDAGRMFKVVGFYPNARGGDLRVEVALDGSGPAEKTGQLVVENFQILGEQVFNELASSGQGKQRIQREVIDFNRMRIPFSVGHGQFVLSESYLRGPVMGMTLRGKIDYRLGRLNIGGTYIPLQGVNAALCDLPIFGQIVAGTNCEGVLGITFALQGSNKNPQVLVNPLSLVAPGIFRDIFQMTGANPRIQERGTPSPVWKAPAAGPRSSSSDAISAPRPNPRRSGPSTIDGWSSSSSQ